MNKIEELKLRIEGVDASLEYFKQEKSELKAELEELEQEEQERKPQMGEEYYYVDTDIMKCSCVGWHNNNSDNIRLQHKVIFKTEDEAEEYLEYLKAKEKAMNEFSKEEWKDNNILKHYIYYDYKDNFFRVDYAWYCRKINEMYFRTKEAAQEFINKYEKFLRRELGV